MQDFSFTLLEVQYQSISPGCQGPLSGSPTLQVGIDYSFQTSVFPRIAEDAFCTGY